MDKKKIFNWSITVALSGFLFGFDTVVISGANLPIKELWNTSPIFHGVFIMSMALWGTVIGSLFGSIPCDRICLLYTSPSPRDGHQSRMPSSA